MSTASLAAYIAYIDTYDKAEREGGHCPACRSPAELLECEYCGESEWTIDCGHYDQPRPLSPSSDGCIRCDDCHSVYGRS